MLSEVACANCIDCGLLSHGVGELAATLHSGKCNYRFFASFLDRERGAVLPDSNKFLTSVLTSFDDE